MFVAAGFQGIMGRPLGVLFVGLLGICLVPSDFQHLRIELSGVVIGLETAVKQVVSGSLVAWK